MSSRTAVAVILLCSAVVTSCSSSRNLPDESLRYLGQPRPGTAPELFAPGTVNTDEFELNGVFSPDFREFYFCRLIDGTHTLHQSRLGNQGWSEPEPLMLFPQKTAAPACDMSISEDGQIMYFLGIHPHPHDDEVKSADTWVSRRVDGNWTTAEALAPPLNTNGTEIYPVVVSDGSVYFASNRSGHGREELYRSQLQADGELAEPTLIAPPINGEHGIGDTYVAPDESYMILASSREPGFGASDLFVAFRSEDGGWSEPVNLGEGVNSESVEYCPMVTPDGKFLFFSRRSATPQAGVTEGNVYWVEAAIIEALR